MNTRKVEGKLKHEILSLREQNRLHKNSGRFQEYKNNCNKLDGINFALNIFKKLKEA